MKIKCLILNLVTLVSFQCVGVSETDLESKPTVPYYDHLVEGKSWRMGYECREYENIYAFPEDYPWHVLRREAMHRGEAQAKHLCGDDFWQLTNWEFDESYRYEGTYYVPCFWNVKARAAFICLN